MAYLVSKSGGIAPAGAVTQNLNTESVEYQKLSAERAVGGGPATVWEEIAEEDIGSAPRLFVINNPGAAAGSDETSSLGTVPGRPGTLTSVLFVADSPGIVGAGTNSRTLTLVQGTAPGAGSPARTTLATLALTAGVNAPAGAASSAFTINQAGFIADAPLEVVSTHVGTGIADPGGLVLATYTPA